MVTPLSLELTNMKTYRIGYLGCLLACLGFLFGMGREVPAQVWQATTPENRPSPSTDNGSAAADWQQRVLRRPALQWHAAGQPSVVVDQTVEPTGYVEEQKQASDERQPSRPRTTVRHSAAQHSPASASPASAFTGRRVTHGGNVFAAGTITKKQGRAGNQRVALTSGEEVIDEGGLQFESVASEGAFADADVAQGDSCGLDCDGCDACGPPCDDACDLGWEVFDGQCGPWLRGLSVFAGVDGFKGPLDRGTNGNFGMNEGLNLARPLGDPWGCGYQIGANFVQSDFSGAPTITMADQYNLRSAFRKQYFATAGLFRRAGPCGGFQGGVAYDYLYDMYYQNTSLQQIRSESGYKINDDYEIGYYGVYGVATERVIDGRLDPTDMFIAYLRRSFENGGDGRLWAGATGQGDGLIGADLWVPLGRSFALENRINFMIPKEGRGDEGRSRESWGLVIQLVWYPGQNAKCQQQNPYRPIFNVADNSLFMVDRLAH
jgi:hypothetical protein